MRFALIDSNPLVNELGDDIINLGYWMQDNVARSDGNCTQTVAYILWTMSSIVLFLMQLFIVALFYSQTIEEIMKEKSANEGKENLGSKE